MTFPFLAVFQLFSAIAFGVSNTRLVIAALYLFALSYSSGESPVPVVDALHGFNKYHLLARSRSTLQRACPCTYVISVRVPLILVAFLTEALAIPRHGSIHLSLVVLPLHHPHHMTQLRRSSPPIPSTYDTASGASQAWF